jgi:hypothetical protein
MADLKVVVVYKGDRGGRRRRKEQSRVDGRRVQSAPIALLSVVVVVTLTVMGEGEPPPESRQSRRRNCRQADGCAQIRR